ncbi:hypothetical protein MPSEU_000830600 [Mayamaea pseudoterrestris]|nr:hypothetical protein MPSEU_000830600 [Mayamaea pseudoterrestris]
MKISQVYSTLLFLASATLARSVDCESAYALCGQGTTPQCFLEDSRLPKPKKWGWHNQITGTFDATTEITCTLWAGAAKCNTDDKTNVGTATITSDSFSIDWAGGYDIGEVHFYHGTVPYPKLNGVNTVAPGQFSNGLVYPASETSWDIFGDPLTMGNYFILHAKICPVAPSGSPSAVPSPGPSAVPSPSPSAVPSPSPSAVPSPTPSNVPSHTPSNVPSRRPSLRPVGTCQEDTAYAKCELVNNPVCFTDTNNWGWTHGVPNIGTFSCTLWAGAAQCDTSDLKKQAGTAISTDGKEFTISLNPQWRLLEVHFYHDVALPTNGAGKVVYAPGTWTGYTVDNVDFTFDIDEGGLQTNEYFILHTKVCKY